MPQSGRRPRHQNRTSDRFHAMSALLTKADIQQRGRDVRLVPATDAFTSNRLLRLLVRKESYHSPQPDRFPEIWSAATLDGRSDCVQTMQARKSER